MSIEQQNNEQKKKRAFKIFSNLWLCSLLVGLSIPIFLIMDYAGGYRGFPLVMPCCYLPAVSVPILVGLILTFYVIIRSIRAAIKLRKLTLSLLLIPLTISLWFVWVIPLRLIPIRHSPFLLGFKHRILRTSSPSELYEIAAKARVLLGDKKFSNDKYISGPGKWSYWDEKHRPLWEQMSKYKVLSIDQSSVVIYVNYDYVTLEWGGMLAGHWGIRIASKPLQKELDEGNFILIDPNIVIFRESD
jgi:hypothetical protein